MAEQQTFGLLAVLLSKWLQARYVCKLKELLVAFRFMNYAPKKELFNKFCVALKVTSELLAKLSS
jgi:hypothetical protein